MRVQFWIPFKNMAFTIYPFLYSLYENIILRSEMSYLLSNTFVSIIQIKLHENHFSDLKFSDDIECMFRITPQPHKLALQDVFFAMLSKKTIGKCSLFHKKAILDIDIFSFLKSVHFFETKIDPPTHSVRFVRL